MTELDLPDHFVAGILSWYSTIHLTPSALDGVLTEFRRLLAPSGVLVVGFFDSDDTWLSSTTRLSRPTDGRLTCLPPASRVRASRRSSA